MTISSGSTPLLVRLPFRGTPIRTSLETLFQNQLSLMQRFCCPCFTSGYVPEVSGMLPLFDMDLFDFIQVVDPTKVKVVERECAEGEEKLLDSIAGRVVSLLPIAPVRVESKLEASVEKLFDEGGSTEQGDFATGGGHGGASLRILDMAVEDIVVGNVTAERPRRQHKKRRAVADATGGKSPSVLEELLASSILNVEAGVEAVATLPLVTSSVFATPERESGVPTDSVTRLSFRTIGPSERFVISSDSSYHSSINAAEARIDSFVRYVAPPPVMTEAVITTNVASIPFVPAPKTSTKVISPVYASMFHDSDSMGKVRPDAAGSSYITGKELSMGSQDINSETLHEFNVRTAHQAYLNAKVRMGAKYCLSERKRLESKCESQADLLKAKDVEIEKLKAQLLLKEAEAEEAARLHIQVSVAEATEKIHADEIDVLTQRNMTLENEKDSLDGKVVELQSLVSAKDLELKDLNIALSSLRSQKDSARTGDYMFQPTGEVLSSLLTTISGRRWLLTHDLKLALVKCLNSQEYLSALGAAISRVIEKGMQDGLSAGIVHGKEGRSLADVAAYNPAMKA
ncbi:hypothetical protein Tco_1325420, partial [Tanacetum coccineum]